MNSIAYFEIQSSNPARDAEFYQQVFGWRFEKVEGLPIEYYRIESDGMHGGLLQRPCQVPPVEYGTNAYTCSIQVENFDATAQKILELGGLQAMPKFAIAGRCWQGYFVDLDNNVFGIFEVDESAQ